MPVGFTLPVVRRALARPADGHPGAGPQLHQLAPHRQGGRLLREHPRGAPRGALPRLRRLGRRQVRRRRLVARASRARRSSTARWPSSSAGWATSSTAATTSSSPATWWPWRSARAARCSSTGPASAVSLPDAPLPFAPMPELIPSAVIDDVVLVRPDVHGDERGRFVETYRRSWFPDRPRDGPGQPLGEAGRRAGRPALPPAPGRLLVRPAGPGPCRPARPARGLARPTGRPRSSISTATSTRASTSRPGSPTGSPP